MLPLSGITVVSIEQAVAAPFASRQLADLGARVIKIERPLSGDFARAYDTTVRGMSSHFVWLNRSKESVTLDLKATAAPEIVEKLLARADVFIQNLAPGAADRLGLGASAVRRKWPTLIACTISGYGSSGPFCDKKAYDLLVQNEAGLVSITGTDDSPCKVAISIADIAAGMYAYSGILTLLFTRERTGEGGTLDVSLFDALGEWMGFPMYFSHYGGTPPRRTGASHATIAPYGPLQTLDGPIAIGLQNEREWVRFCTDVLHAPDLAADPRFATNSERARHRTDLDREINRVFAAVTREEAVSRLDAADIANARMNTVDEFVAHPQHEARGRWREIDSPVGPLVALTPPAIIDGVEPAMAPVPELGQHTDAILEELGYDVAKIAAFRSQGVV